MSPYSFRYLFYSFSYLGKLDDFHICVISLFPHETLTDKENLIFLLSPEKKKNIYKQKSINHQAFFLCPIFIHDFSFIIKSLNLEEGKNLGHLTFLNSSYIKLQKSLPPSTLKS